MTPSPKGRGRENEANFDDNWPGKDQGKIDDEFFRLDKGSQESPVKK